MKKLFLSVICCTFIYGATLEKMAAQMLLVGFNGTEISQNHPIYNEIATYKIGGVILFDYDLQTKSYARNVVSPQQLKKLTNDLQSIDAQTLFIAVDYEGGKVNRLKQKYGFIHTYSQKVLSGFKPQFTYEQTKMMAKTLQKSGINVNFAPVVDLCIDKNNPVIAKLGRCYASDAHTVAAYAKQAIKAYQSEGILPVIKHFPGHGSSSGDSHLGFVDVTSSYDMSELEVYKTLLRTADVQAVMSAHVFNERFDATYPATLSKATIEGVLRNELGFEGLVFSDDLQMKAISDHYDLKTTLALLINAGVDIFIIGNNLEKYDVTLTPKIIETIKTLVEEGVVSIKQIEKSYAKILKQKAKL
jgi:beta-N-acetylhexosaminidase